MSPATLVYFGYSASEVCFALAQYSNEVRRLHAVDALVTAIVYNRKDTVEVLTALETPQNIKGMLGVTVQDLHGGTALR